MLNEREVADIMKKDVPRLLHKRIAELEFQIADLIDACDALNDILECNTGRRKNFSDNTVESAKEILKKEII